MKNLYFLLFFLFPLIGATQSKQVDTILKAHFEAINQDALSKINSLTINGLFIQNGMQLPLLIHKKRPDKWRQQIALNQQKMIVVLNGQKGWEINQFVGVHVPTDYDKTKIREHGRSTTIDNLLWYLINNGAKLEYIHDEILDNKKVYQLKATDASGNISNIYIDTDTKLLLKTEDPKNNRIFHYQAYQTVDGIVFPKKVSLQQPQGNYEIEFTTIALNPDLEETLFTKPVVQTTEQIAKKYLKTFYDLDYKNLKNYYTDTSFWYDPSTAVIIPNVQKSIGKNKIIADLRSGFNGVFEAHYSIEKAFYSGPYATLWGTYSYKIPAKYFQGLQNSNAVFDFSIPMVTNLLIQDGKVLEHLEHGDWTTWSKQVQAHVQKLKSKDE